MSDYNTNGLNASHIYDNIKNDYYEAARSSFFVFEVPFTKLPKINVKKDVADVDATTEVIVNAKEYLKLNVVKCKMQDFSVETLQYKRGNEIVKFAGTPKWESGSITVDDIVGLDTKSILTAWLHLAYNPHTTKGGRMKDYKIDCTLYEYTQDYQKIREWKLYGCFVTSLTNDDFDKENDAKRQITATIEYDKAIMSLPVEQNA